MSSIVNISAGHANNVLNAMASTFLEEDVIDQITTEKVTMAALLRKAKPMVLGGNPKIQTRLNPVNEGSHYGGADVRNFQSPTDPLFASYAFSEGDLGLQITETELKNYGYLVVDQQDAIRLPDSENKRLADVFQTQFGDKMSDMVIGMENFAAKCIMLDGTQSAKATPGLDAFISLTPAVGTIGSLNRATYAGWRNYAQTGIANPTTTDSLASAFRYALRYCRKAARATTGAPDIVTCGEAFYEAASARAHARNTMESNMGDMADFQFLNGKIMVGKAELQWDPYFEVLDTAFPGLTVPWTKRCYGINSNDIQFRYLPATGGAKGRGVSPAQNVTRADLFVMRNPIRPSNQYLFLRQMQLTSQMQAKALNTSFVLAIA